MYAHRRKNSKRACSARQRARGRHKSTRGATESSRAKFHMFWPRGLLNPGTERPGGEEERTPSSLNRAPRRTKLEVHGDARTRPVSERLRKRDRTPSRTVLGPLLSPFKAPRRVKARGRHHMSDDDRAAFAKTAHFATKTGQVAMADLCREWGLSKTQGSIFPCIWTTQAIRWRALWTTKVCMPHSLLLSHDKFMLQKLRPPRFALSCNSRKKREKKDPSTNLRVMNRCITFRTEVSIYIAIGFNGY